MQQSRPLPQPKRLRLRAERLAKRVIELDDALGFWEQRTHVEVIDGKPVELVDHALHEDPTLSELMAGESIGAVIQSDRSRAYRRGPDNPVEVYVMNSMELPFPFERHIQIGDLACWLHDMAADFGFVPDIEETTRGVNRFGALTYPDRFDDHHAAANGWRGDRLAVFRQAVFSAPIRFALTVPGERYHFHIAADPARWDQYTIRDYFEDPEKAGQLAGKVRIKR